MTSGWSLILLYINYNLTQGYGTYQCDRQLFYASLLVTSFPLCRIQCAEIKEKPDTGQTLLVEISSSNTNYYYYNYYYY